jgi:hypothetical protein
VILMRVGQIGEIVEEEAMKETIAASDATKEDTRVSVIEEGFGMPREEMVGS